MTWEDWQRYSRLGYWESDTQWRYSFSHGSGYVNLYSKFQLFPQDPFWSAFTECCFAPGSQILMADGATKNIEDVAVGDEVVSYNLHTQQFENRKVIGTIINSNSTDVVDLTLTDGTVLTMRAYHPLLTSKGWKSLREHEGLPLLTEDDEIITYTELQHITHVVARTDLEGSTTYNLNVEGHEDGLEGCDNFVVNGVVAHNACAT